MRLILNKNEFETDERVEIHYKSESDHVKNIVKAYYKNEMPRLCNGKNKDGERVVFDPSKYNFDTHRATSASSG